MKLSKMKRLLAYLLVLTMLASVAAFSAGTAYASEIQEVTMELSDVDKQLQFIHSQLGSLRQDSSENTWYYMVSDLDHDGNLEFVAASLHPLDRSTNLHVWEVSKDRTALNEIKLNKDADESFPDIMTDSADTFHNLSTDVWSYMFYDNIILTDTNVYTIKTAVSMKDDTIGYAPYAVEHTEIVYGQRSVSHTDASGVAISGEQYNAAGVNAFVGAERSSTNFEWLKADEIDNIARLIDSIAVFAGHKAPTENFPVPRPAALEAEAAATPAPAATVAPTAAPAAPAPTPAAQPEYLLITKNPTNESRKQGDTAYFVACANVFDSLNWTFVSPDGGEYSTQSFDYMYGNVGGQSSTTLSIGNVTPEMSGWGAYCTFYYRGQTARTTTAYLTVAAKQNPAAPSGTYSGTVTGWNYGSVTVFVAGQVSVTIPFSLCDIDGDLYNGAPASVYWDGSNVTYCYIKGETKLGPVYGSMNGTASEGGGGYAINLSNGTQVYVDAWKCNVSGIFYNGASCVVYYQNYPSNENIYSVDIYGANEWEVPTYTTYDQRIQNEIENGGGWAGAHYYDSMPYAWSNTDAYGNTSGGIVYDEPVYNPVGDEHNRVTCPVCGNHFSPGYNSCPFCGWTP